MIHMTSDDITPDDMLADEMYKLEMADKRNRKLKRIVGRILYIGVCAGLGWSLFLVVLFFVHTAVEDGKQIVREEMQLQIDTLQQEKDELAETLNLAIEFGYDPMIVMLVSSKAKEIVKPDEPGKMAWRFIKTPQYATYMMLSLIYAESGGDRWAVGDSGKARGLTQIWTSTARDYDSEITDEALLDPATNIDISFLHFESLLEKYRGNIALALYAWNRGQGKVDNLLNYGQSPNNGYGEKVYEAAIRHNALMWPIQSARASEGNSVDSEEGM